MAKPNRISYKNVQPIVDGIKLPRVQSLDITGELPLENVLELGNAGIVEKISQTPNITVDLTTNDMSLDTIAALANRFKSVPFDGLLNTPGGTAAGQVGKGFNNLHTTARGGLTAKRGAGTTAILIGDFTVSDFDVGTSGEAIASEILYRVQSPGATTILACGHIGKAFLNNWSAAYTADGIATETFSFTAQKQYWYYGPHLKLAEATQVDIADPGTLKLDYDRVLGTTAFKILHNSNVYYNSAFYAAVVGQSTLGTNAFNMPTTGLSELKVQNPAPSGGFVAGDYIRVLMFSSGVNWSSVSTAYGNYPGGSEGGAVDILLDWSTSAAPEKTLRCQSVNITTPLDREDLRQLGDPTKFFEALTFPINVSFDVEMLASDAEIWLKASARDADYGQEALTDTDVSIADLTKEMKLTVRIYKDKNSKTESTLLKQIVVPGAKLQTQGRTAGVGNNDTETFTFTADQIKVAGNGLITAGSSITNA